MPPLLQRPPRWPAEYTNDTPSVHDLLGTFLGTRRPGERSCGGTAATGGPHHPKDHARRSTQPRIRGEDRPSSAPPAHPGWESDRPGSGASLGQRTGERRYVRLLRAACLSRLPGALAPMAGASREMRIGLRGFRQCHRDEAICHDDRSPHGVAHPFQASRRVGRGREPNSDGSGSARASTPAATPEIPPLRPRRRQHSPRCYRARRDRSGRPTGGE